MGTINIGGKDISLATPPDASAQLLDATGLSPAELLAALGEASAPAIIALALLVFVDKDKPALSEFGKLVAADMARDRFAAINALRDLLAEDSAPVAPAKPAKGGAA